MVRLPRAWMHCERRRTEAAFFRSDGFQPLSLVDLRSIGAIRRQSHR